MQALLVVDVQQDFLPGGALAVPRGDEILSVINRLMERFEHVWATRDWHPPDHKSFSIWPPHCVQGTKGAEISPRLNRGRFEGVIDKGVRPEDEGYSAFEKTALDRELKKRSIDTLYVVGLATDFCVLQTVLDGLKLGYIMYVVQDGCRAIGDELAAIEKMRARGARILESRAV